jgi:hypothetical protein
VLDRPWSEACTCPAASLAERSLLTRWGPASADSEQQYSSVHPSSSAASPPARILKARPQGSSTTRADAATSAHTTTGNAKSCWIARASYSRMPRGRSTKSARLSSFVTDRAVVEAVLAGQQERHRCLEPALSRISRRRLSVRVTHHRAAGPASSSGAVSLRRRSLTTDDARRAAPADLLNKPADRRWLLAYDNVPQVAALYPDRRRQSSS